MKRIAILLVLFNWLLYGCGSSKEVSQTTTETTPPPPTWVNGKPASDLYYHGIGFCLKSTNPLEYAKIAKENALQDLSSEIAVTINSTSVLYQVEQNDRFREDFKSNTRLKTLSYLEGFELVETYETDREFWVFYRLDKIRFEQLKNERRSLAVEKSKDLLSKALQFKASGNYYQAIIFHIQALEAVGDFLGEPLQTNFNQQEVYLGNELNAQFLKTLFSIKIIAQPQEVTLKRGNFLPPQTYFQVTDESGKAISNLPLYLYYSGGKIQEKSVMPNHEGKVFPQVGRVNSKNAQEFIEGNINLVKMVQDATTDPVVSALVGQVHSPSNKISLFIERPQIYILSQERIEDQPQKTLLLKNAFQQEFLNAGFAISPSKSKADFVLVIEANTNAPTTSNRFVTSNLNAEFKLFNQKNELVYTDHIDQLRGVQMDKTAAGQEAYSKAVQQIQKSVFLNMNRRVFE